MFRVTYIIKIVYTFVIRKITWNERPDNKIPRQ